MFSVFVALLICAKSKMCEASVASTLASDDVLIPEEMFSMCDMKVVPGSSMQILITFSKAAYV